MDRRSFLKNSALGGSAAAATALAAPAYAQGNRTLTLVTTWGRGLAGVHDAAQRAADTITAMTDGALTIDLKAAGELVGAFEVFDAADPNVPCARRDRSTTPLQALTLLNEPGFVECARALGLRALELGTAATSSRARQLFRLLLTNRSNRVVSICLRRMLAVSRKNLLRPRQSQALRLQKPKHPPRNRKWMRPHLQALRMRHWAICIQMRWNLKPVSAAASLS